MAENGHYSKLSVLSMVPQIQYETLIIKIELSASVSIEKDQIQT